MSYYCKKCGKKHYLTSSQIGKEHVAYADIRTVISNSKVKESVRNILDAISNLTSIQSKLRNFKDVNTRQEFGRFISDLEKVKNQLLRYVKYTES